MVTFTWDPRCWWIFRIVSRNPLLRRCDRIEAFVALVAVVATLVAIPAAGIAGSVVYTARDRQYAAEALTRHVFTATVTAGPTVPDPGTATASAMHPAPGPIRGSLPAEVVQHIKIWVDSDGKPVAPPTPAYRAVIDATGAAVVILLGAAGAMSCLLGATYRRADQVRDAQWEREIRCLQSGTGRSSQS